MDGIYVPDSDLKESFEDLELCKIHSNYDKLEETSLVTPGLNNPETYVLTHNRFNTYIVLIFTDLKKLRFSKCLIDIVHLMK